MEAAAAAAASEQALNESKEAATQARMPHFRDEMKKMFKRTCQSNVLGV
jgi:hypothetical protein